MNQQVLKKKDEYTKYGKQKETAWIEIAEELPPEFMLCEKTHTCLSPCLYGFLLLVSENVSNQYHQRDLRHLIYWI